MNVRDRDTRHSITATERTRGRSFGTRSTIPLVITENVVTKTNILQLQGDSNVDVLSSSTPRKVSLLDWGNMDNPDSFGTHYHNGTLTLAVNGLSLEKSWSDPRKGPPWVCPNVYGLLDSPFECDVSMTRKSNGPAKLLRIIELENGESLPCPLGPNKCRPEPNAEEQSICNDSSTTMFSKRRSREEPSPGHTDKKQKASNFEGKLSHSSIINQRSKRGRGRQKGKKHGIHKEGTLKKETELKDVVISPSKEVVEAERLGLLGGKKKKINGMSQAVEAGGTSPTEPNEKFSMELSRAWEP